MVRIEDRCVECSIDMGCIGPSCPNRAVEVHYCDKCDDELIDIYDVDGQELCLECLKDLFRRITDG